MDIQNLLVVSVIALWTVVLLNLGLTLTFVRWAHTLTTIKEELQQPELELGIPAPEFRARRLNGETVTLASYAGRSVLLLLVSPNCGHCRARLPMLHKLAAAARQRAAVDFVLISDGSLAKTQAWLDTIHEEDGLLVTLPVLCADRRTFHRVYNPAGLFPSYCLLDEEHKIQGRGSVGGSDWLKLKETWEGNGELRRLITANRYR